MSKKDILSLINERILLLDGATGTQLIEMGMKDGECPDLWNIEKKHLIQEVHRRYYEAGADVVCTNTFGSTRIKLSKYNLQNRVRDINLAGIKLIKEVCPPDRFFAGDMGPTGKFLPPVGDGDIQEFQSAFEEQARLFLEGGVDLIMIETMYDIREAEIAVKSAKTTGLPVFVTMTFDKKKRGYFTFMGNSVKDSFQILESAGADAVGANCTLVPQDFIELTREMKKSTSLPVIVQPNAGQPQREGDHIHYNETPEAFAETMKVLIEEGAGIIGSCCGSTPAFTKKLKDLIKI